MPILTMPQISKQLPNKKKIYLSELNVGKTLYTICKTYTGILTKVKISVPMPLAYYTKLHI